MLYFVSHGASTNAKKEKNGFMIRTREPTADYIPKGLPQLIVIVNCVRKGVRLGMTEILYLAPTMNEANLILQETVEELFKHQIECIASKVSRYIKTPNCRIQFLSWSMGEQKFKGRRCDIAINFPDEWQQYLTRGHEANRIGDQDLLETIVKIEKAERRK